MISCKRLSVYVIYTALAFLSCTCKDELRSVDKMAASFNQILWLSAEIMVYNLECSKEGEEFRINEAVKEISKVYQLDSFRCECDTNLWVAINPESERWHEDYVGTNEIAMYCPVPLHNKKSGKTNYVGITFSLKKVILSEFPCWRPLSIWNSDSVRTTTTH
jgi:hypothetical protein